tara:strand:- start:9 stop:245 length:237 start_codon:yes stop_codon:yes gene_type:complete
MLGDLKGIAQDHGFAQSEKSGLTTPIGATFLLASSASGAHTDVSNGVAEHWTMQVNMFNSFQYSYEFTRRFDRINIFQ